MHPYKNFKVGNLVKFEDKPVQIESISSANGRTDVRLKYLKDNLWKPSLDTTIEKIEPIKLDNKILKKWNFEIVDMNKYRCYQFPKDKSFYIIEKENIFQFCTRGNIRMINVHELQNLFYLQTKYELPILDDRFSIQ